MSAADVLAALKLAVGRNPNPDPDGPGLANPRQVSPFQWIAADVDGNGKIDRNDPIKLSSSLLNPTLSGEMTLARWAFIDERIDFDANQSTYVSRASTDWTRLPLSSPSTPESIGLAAVLIGDVNGSWGQSAAGTDTVNTVLLQRFEYLDSQMGIPVSQWGL